MKWRGIYNTHNEINDHWSMLSKWMNALKCIIKIKYKCASAYLWHQHVLSDLKYVIVIYT